MKAKNDTRRHELGLAQTNAGGVASTGKCASSSMYIRGPNVANREESREGLMNGNCAEGSEESRALQEHSRSQERVDPLFLRPPGPQPFLE